MTKIQKYVPKLKSRSGWHEINGCHYHVNLWGNRDNPPIFLLHGWGDCSFSFQFLVDFLKHDWFVVAPDWRGFGSSTIQCESYWFPDYIADLHALIKVYQPHDPVLMLGHSMGANIGHLFAGIFPERVAKFINVEGFGLNETNPSQAPENYRRWITFLESEPQYKSYSSYKDLARKIMIRNPLLSEDRALFLAYHWSERISDKLIKLKIDPKHKFPNAILYRRAEAKACWDRVTAELLLVIGENTKYKKHLNSPTGIDEFKEELAKVETVLISQAGHMIHIEQPEKLAQICDKFFK